MQIPIRWCFIRFHSADLVVDWFFKFLVFWDFSAQGCFIISFLGWWGALMLFLLGWGLGGVLFWPILEIGDV